MSETKVTDENTKTLEFKADLAYQTLRLAVQTKLKWVLDSAKNLYEHDLGKYIRNLILPTTEIVNLCKGGQRGEEIEEYIVQYLLMSDSRPIGPVNTLPEYKVKENPNDGMGGLQAWIDAEDRGDAIIGVVFRTMQNKAIQIREENRYDLILTAIDYVRRKYSRSETPLLLLN
ncbi:MAG: hypothetical protein Q8R04_07580 [Nanoarchaeota archaeon]|nr:hypothetical protein [Nanoarchaeota archaeon]